MKVNVLSRLVPALQSSRFLWEQMSKLSVLQALILPSSEMLSPN